MRQTYFKSQTKTRKQLKARRARHEAAVRTAVRAACVERDGVCRMAHLARYFGACAGPLAWCHMEGKRRHQTRNLPPEERHGTAWTLMLCAFHSELEERHVVRVRYLTARGCNGPVMWQRVA